MPRPGSKVIHPDFEARHQLTAEGTQTAACVITRTPAAPGTVSYDTATGRSVYPDPTTVYTGPCRLQREVRSQDHARDVGGRQVTSRRYLLTVPLDAAEVQVNDIVEMTAATDPQTVGRRLRVTDVRAGSLLWQRAMSCEEWEPTTR